MVINTEGSPPIRCAPRRVIHADREKVRSEIKKILDNGIIEKSDSPWSSPIHLVKKKDGKIRFFIDFRALKSKDAYPLPRIDETLEALNGAKYFTIMNFTSGY
jgi:hypothetical protein